MDVARRELFGLCRHHTSYAAAFRVSPRHTRRSDLSRQVEGSAYAGTVGVRSASARFTELLPRYAETPPFRAGKLRPCRLGIQIFLRVEGSRMKVQLVREFPVELSREYPSNPVLCDAFIAIIVHLRSEARGHCSLTARRCANAANQCRGGSLHESVETSMVRGGSTNAQRWYAIRSKPKQEVRAESNLQAWGIETFLPRIREWRRRRHASGSAHCTAPLFPGYLFARFDAAQLLGKIRLTRGVHNVVAFGDTATPVEDAILALIRSRVQADGLVHIDEPAPGDLVEIVDGPLRSLVGVFDASSTRGERVRILLATLARPAHVQVPKAFIRRLAPRAVI